MRPSYKAVKCVRHMAETSSFLISCYDYMKERQILCSFPIAICMLLFYLLWAKFISYTCSLKNMELIRLEFSSVNISTILVNCCFLSVFWTVFQERKKGKIFLYIFLMTLADQTALQYRCQYLVLYYLQLSKTVDCCVIEYLKIK